METIETTAARAKKGKGTKWMVVVDGQGVPLGSLLASASPAEVKLAEKTLDAVTVPRCGRSGPKKLPNDLSTTMDMAAPFIVSVVNN
jgi:hypothetical protein